MERSGGFHLKVLYGRAYDADVDDMHVGEGDRERVVLSVDHHLIRSLTDVAAFRDPGELHDWVKAIRCRWCHHCLADLNLKRSAGGLQRHNIAIRVGARNQKVEGGTGDDTGVGDGGDLRDIVVTSGDEDLHIANHRANLNPSAPFLDHDCHIIFPLHHGILPP